MQTSVQRASGAPMRPVAAQVHRALHPHSADQHPQSPATSCGVPISALCCQSDAYYYSLHDHTDTVESGSPLWPTQSTWLDGITVSLVIGRVVAVAAMVQRLSQPQSIPIDTLADERVDIPLILALALTCWQSQSRYCASPSPQLRFPTLMSPSSESRPPPQQSTAPLFPTDKLA
ncbi:hypothetical protein IAQ61_001701 [Plenodomus lingam]|uniref:uncharacterized protein n=1 Tax=Leptosphaeria maculans TaxID=5022 RepID=UPI0033315F27|nr:hypothetical protein IAQ61_001701 [Plenodomus lingam]